MRAMMLRGSRPLTQVLEETAEFRSESGLSDVAKMHLLKMRGLAGVPRGVGQQLNARLDRRHAQIVEDIHSLYGVSKARVLSYALERLVEDLQG